MFVLRRLRHIVKAHGFELLQFRDQRRGRRPDQNPPDAHLVSAE